MGDECQTNQDCTTRGTPGYCRAGRDPSGANRFTCRSHPCQDDQQYEPGKGCMDLPGPP